MRCLLVMPRSFYPSNLTVWPASGIGYIAAVLKRIPGLQLVTLNLNMIDREKEAAELGAVIKSEKIQVVLSGGLGYDFKSIRSTFEIAKRSDLAIVTITGGALVSGDPEAAMEALEWADYGIIGEGERTVAELLQALMDHGPRADCSRLPGLILEKNGRWHITPPRSAIADWSEIPWPDYAAFGYAAGWKPPDGMGLRINVPASRGCCFKCTFCHNSQGAGFRPRPLDDFFKEMAARREQFPSALIDVTDDLLADSKPRLADFCEGMKSLGFKNWQISMRVNQVDEASVDLLGRAGCRLVFLGLESVSDKILKSMNKKTTRRQVEKAAAVLSAAGLPFRGSFIFGDREETWETATETLNWWQEHPEYEIFLNPIILYPGSTLYKKACLDGLIKDRVAFLESAFPPTNISRMDDQQYEALLGKLDELMQARNSRPDLRLKNFTAEYHYGSMEKTVTGTCRHCGADLVMKHYLPTGSCPCPECGAWQSFPPAPDNYPEMIARNVVKLIEKYGRFAFWGTGKVFRSMISPELASLDGIHLIDRNPSAGIYGAKKIETPEAIPSRGIQCVIATVNQVTPLHNVILDDAAAISGVRRTASIYQLHDGNFKP